MFVKEPFLYFLLVNRSSDVTSAGQLINLFSAHSYAKIYHPAGTLKFFYSSKLRQSVSTRIGTIKGREFTLVLGQIVLFYAVLLF